MFKEGLTRFCTSEYTRKIRDVKKKFVHLTNYSVNKASKKFVRNSKVELDNMGSKWSLTALKKYYSEHEIDSEAVIFQ